MVSNSEIEMRWVEAWNDLYALAAAPSAFQCQLPNGEVVDLDTCKGWLQDAIYKGFLLEIHLGRVMGRPGAIVCKLSQV